MRDLRARRAPLPTETFLPMTIQRALLGVLAFATALAPATAQEMPLSGVTGRDFVYASSPSGTSQAYMLALTVAPAALPLGAPVASVPSRWAHRRRTLGALETQIAFDGSGVLLTPMGDAPGNGAIHMLDARLGAPIASLLVPTGNPAGYDLALLPALDLVFSAEDDGAGSTILRGYSYATPGQLTPLSPPSLTLPGAPAAYVNRIGVDADANLLHVPTVNGIAIVSVSTTAPNLVAGPFVTTTPAVPATNPTSFTHMGSKRWMVGTSRFNEGNAPLEAGYASWNSFGVSNTGLFGIVPSVPTKNWVPAAGAEELAVVSNGTDAYAYFLLREPGPGTFFVKGSAVGVIRILGSAAPTIGTIACSDTCGEPFAIPTVSGTRVALETSFGPPFVFEPADGGERVVIIYSPLDPLGASTPFGLLAVPAPLGGRISTKGMDRPLWTRDGTRVVAATSQFPGAPHPAIPGLEVLDVPASVAVNEFNSPNVVVPNATFPNQSIVFPTAFAPRIPALASFLAPFSFFGNVFNDGFAAIMAAPKGEIGQKQIQAPIFVQPTPIPNFRAIFPPTFNDVNGSTVAVPASFGARRTSFNLYPGLGSLGLVMVAAIDNTLRVELTGFNFSAALAAQPTLPVIPFPLPAGWVTTTEFLSL